MSTHENAPPLPGWAPVVHRDSPLNTPAAEPSEDHLIRGTE